jgi:sugar O-acyltransferase (sialic acid O-acetyltransferase NeuD family)
MPKQITEIILLGFSPGSICNITETAFKCYGCKNFKVILNIDLSDNDIPFIHESFSCTLYRLEEIEQGNIEKFDFSNVHFGVNHSHIRPVIFEDFKKKLNLNKGNYLSIIHPTSEISMSSSHKEGFFTEELTIVSSFSEIGFGVNLKRGSSVGHHSKIGDYVTMNPGATLSGFVTIGEGTEIGSGATVLHDVTIGKHCLIGAGSVVTKDVPDGMIAYGNPCKVIRENERWVKTKQLLQRI